MDKLSYISFLWKSSNLHGLHSPFVYHIAANGIYARHTPQPHKRAKLPPGLSRPAARLLYRLIASLKLSKMFVLGDNAAEVTELLRAAGDAANTKPWFFSPLAPIPGGFDLAYISADDPESLMALYRQALPNAADHSILAVPAIHASAASEVAWEAIKKDPGVTATIDTYHLGLIFFKSGRQQQHFYIRTGNGVLLNAVLGIRNLWGLLG